MSQWKNEDSAANSVLWGVVGFNKPANSVTQTAFFGNTTADAYVTGLTVGQFGVDVTEVNVSNGSIISFQIISPGSGYLANTTVTVSGNGTANATAFANGRISAVTVIASGNNYTAKPTVTITAPTAQTFNASTLVANTTDFIAISPNPFVNNDIVTYLVAGGNTTLTNLANAGVYFIAAANSTGVKLSSTLGGPIIDLTSGVSETGHSLTGQTATAAAVLSYTNRPGLHAGWVIRTVGSGGRAGRVQYETLVAMGSMTGDAEDVVFKDN